MADAAAAGGSGRGETARVLGGLDDHDRGGKGGDQPVAREEVGRPWLTAGRVLARQGAAGRSHPVEQAGVGPRIGNVHPAAQDDDGDSTGVQGAAMGGRVDADRAATEHAPAGPGQSGADGAGGRPAQRRGAATTHHRDRRRRLGRGRSGDEEPGAWRVGRSGRQGPALVARDQEPQAESGEPRSHSTGLRAVRPEQAHRVSALRQPGRHRGRQRPRGGGQRQQHLPLPYPRSPPPRTTLSARHRWPAQIGLIRARPPGRR